MSVALHRRERFATTHPDVASPPTRARRRPAALPREAGRHRPRHDRLTDEFSAIEQRIDRALWAVLADLAERDVRFGVRWVPRLLEFGIITEAEAEVMLADAHARWIDCSARAYGIRLHAQSRPDGRTAHGRPLPTAAPDASVLDFVAAAARRDARATARHGAAILATLKAAA